MQKNNNVKFEILRLPPENTNSVLVSNGIECVIFDAWGNVSDWQKILATRGLKLRAIYATHGHPDHISAAPGLAQYFDVDWFLNANDNEKLLLNNNIYLESNSNKSFDLYIWVSYQEDVDQLDMLNGIIKSNLYVEGYDSINSICNK